MYQAILYGIAGETIPDNSFVYFKQSDGKIYLAYVNDLTKRASFFVKVGVTSGSMAQAYGSGIFSYTTSGTVGLPLYLASAGATSPTLPDGFQQQVAIVVAANTIMLNFRERANSTQQYILYSTNAAAVMVNNVDNVLDAGALVLNWPITFPASPEDGSGFRITFLTAVTTVTMTAAGGITISGGITSAILGSSVNYKYYARASTPRWGKQQ